MFTGVVQGVGRVERVLTGSAGSRRLQVLPPAGLGPQPTGASVALDGCCLSVVDSPGQALAFEVTGATLGRTTLGQRAEGDWVNVERSLRVGDALDGHWVSGHIDGVGRIAQLQAGEGTVYMHIEVDAALLPLCAPRGSLAVAGISLTCYAVGDAHITVALIPHTLAVTTLGRLAVGDPVNVEADMMARYAARLLACQR